VHAEVELMKVIICTKLINSETTSLSFLGANRQRGVAKYNVCAAENDGK